MTEESPEPDIARYLEIAKRFLHSAVVVDDEARMQHEQPTPLTTPDRRNRPDAPGNADAEPTRSLSLDAASLSRAFAQHGVVCGVLVPAPDDPMTETIVHAAARADVVILDWQLGGDDGAGALAILETLRNQDGKRGDRIRLVVIYTGEPDLQDILERVQCAMPEETEVEKNALRLRYRNCRVMLFGKNRALLSEDNQAFAFEESALPTALIGAWVEMDAGVLPSLALLSLTAVRENAHAVLAKFRRDLDPAFMTHRACLPFPEDAEQHVVDQIASELRAVMAEGIVSETYLDTLKTRVLALWKSKQEMDAGSETILRDDATAALLKGGSSASPWWNDKKIDAKRVRKLTQLFSGGDVSGAEAEELDCEFTWLMTSRTVRGPEPRTLHLGVVVKAEGEDGRILLCLMPHCDSVRLKDSTRFLFAPLEDASGRGPQLVVRRDDGYERRTVSGRIADWEQIKFSANREQRVVAVEKDGGWCFRTSAEANAKRFRWLGELRMEWAQHLAHTLGTRITRVAVNTPEWLRRQERG